VANVKFIFPQQFFSAHFLVLHKPPDPVSEETSRCDQSQLCTVSWTSSSLKKSS